MLMNSPAEPIVIPVNKAGERAFELLRSIAEKYLNIARAAADGLISTDFPNSEKVEEPLLRQSAALRA